jgi:hypothetical protein
MLHDRSFRRIATPIAAALLAALVSIGSAPLPTYAANNQATGDIAGNAANLGASNLFTINSTQLALVKAAFLTDGTPIASGATVAKGTPVKFMIYLDNTTAVPVDSVNVQDALNAAFVYQPGTIRISNTVNTGAAVAAIFAATDVAPLLSDAVSNADVAGISGTTISAGDGTGNGVVTVPASKVWAVLFTVKVQ